MKINDVEIPDPTGYQDGYDSFFSDNITLALKRQRNRLGKKKYAKLRWTMLTPEEFQALAAMFQDGSEVEFENDSSTAYGTFSFTALPDLPLGYDDYYGGGTFMRDLEVTLREV